jgi:hypothetical protein
MQNMTTKIGLTFISIFCLLLLTGAPSHAEQSPSQRDWLITLVDALGWSFGLPDEPSDQDYLNIMTGKRTFRFEAEETYASDEDELAVMIYSNFGEFSGDSWLQAVRKTTPVHLRFNLPIAGSYDLAVALRSAPHEVSAGGQTFQVDGENNFSEVRIGTLELSAGPQEIVVTLPPDGSIDYLQLTATNQQAIAPAGGWQLDNPLDWNAINTTLIQIFDLAAVLPIKDEPLIIQAEDLAEIDTAKVVSISFLGRPHNGQWIRAGSRPAAIEIPFKAEQTGFYRFSINAMGKQLGFVFDQHSRSELSAKASLKEYRLPDQFLEKGQHQITVHLPPSGGIDQLTIQAYDSELAAMAKALGHSASPATPQATDLNRLTTLLASFGSHR